VLLWGGGGCGPPRGLEAPGEGKEGAWPKAQTAKMAVGTGPKVGGEGGTGGRGKARRGSTLPKGVH